MYADPTPPMYTCTRVYIYDNWALWKTIFNPKLLYVCYMHVMQHACSMHGNVPNPCTLHEICVLHACRYKWNMHVTCAKVNAWHHLNYACNMYVTCTRFRIGIVEWRYQEISRVHCRILLQVWKSNEWEWYFHYGNNIISKGSVPIK